MTNFGTTTIGGQLYFLTKNGGLCTTCCYECVPQVVSSVPVGPGNTLTYSQYFTTPAPIKTGYWRIYDQLRDMNGYNPVVASGVVTGSVYIGLSSQYTNIFATAATYFDFSVCCDNDDWVIVPHNNLFEQSYYWTWTPPTPGSFITLDANTSLSFEPANPALYAYWGVGCWVDGAPAQWHIQVDRGSVNSLGTFVNMKTQYSVPSSKCTGTRWYVYVYDFTLL